MEHGTKKGCKGLIVFFPYLVFLHDKKRAASFLK